RIVSLLEQQAEVREVAIGAPLAIFGRGKVAARARRGRARVRPGRAERCRRRGRGPSPRRDRASTRPISRPRTPQRPARGGSALAPLATVAPGAGARLTRGPE